MSATREDMQTAEEVGYTVACLDLRAILLEEMSKGNKTIDLWELDNRMEQRMNIRKVTGMSLNESDFTLPQYPKL
jgi:hypothetical protein